MSAAMATAMASRVTQYVSVSGAVVYYYDFILTIDAERQLFWRIGGSWIVRIVFILTRYLPAIGLPLGLLRTNHSWDIYQTQRMNSIVFFHV
ncbi:SubName: Full=Uncharacterized protein {ECO:0000313/EMBL:CCA72117.1} [Serendipita indica DSM 11827]|nr:SubName: Full=Uncharacterized protein {ECO:0000313/EMBL:CCA72117.1} [Serendipita indica DSM 11827]